LGQRGLVRLSKLYGRRETHQGFRTRNQGALRILIPGVYAVGLIRITGVRAEFGDVVVGKGTASVIAVGFFVGLIGYALRAHERWFPYYINFERYRVELKDAIDRVLGTKTEGDNVNVYKYFLETKASDISDRIHYFSSFYYMLTELSLFSGMAAYFFVAQCLFSATKAGNSRGATFGAVLIGFAVLVQLVALFPLSGVRTSRTKTALVVEVVLAILGVVSMVVAYLEMPGMDVRRLLREIGWTPVVFVIASYLFWRLAEKHWKQVIREQVVLVSDRAADLIAVNRTFVAF